jgi:hypothetical protein
MNTFPSKIRFITGLTIAYLVSLSSVSAQPVALNDRLLNKVTAGTDSTVGSGGAIIGNSSEATINQTGGVDLSGEVQALASALNLVNSAESTVANGVNIWDGGAITSGLEGNGAGVLLNQSNEISQEQRRSASMPNYSRPEADTLVQIDRSGSEAHNDTYNRNNSVTDLVRNDRITSNTSEGWVDTTIKANATDQLGIDTNVGKGIAIAGTIDATLDAGEVQFGLAVGGPVTAPEDTNAGGFGGLNVGEDDTTVSLYGRIILPEMRIEISGAGCGVLMGSCGSSGSSSETTNDVVDTSVMDTLDTTSVGNSEYSEVMTEAYRSPFELNNAQAEYIVVDDSSLNVNTTFTLALSGSAQSSVKAMNVVNATGSAVANGVNVARTTQMDGGKLLSLSQSNVITHSR